MNEPFDLKKALMGQAVCTREGKAVRILRTTAGDANKHIIVRDETGFSYQIWPDGRWVRGKDNPRDVLLIEGAFIDVDPWDGVRPEPVTMVSVGWECPVCHAGVRADQTRCAHV